jgi:hypothetical protein
VLHKNELSKLKVKLGFKPILKQPIRGRPFLIAHKLDYFGTWSGLLTT